MPKKQNAYLVHVLRGWTKEKLAERMMTWLENVQADEIISIECVTDPFVWPFWRRNAAIITLRPASDE